MYIPVQCLLFRVVKEFIAALGANATPDAVEKLGKCLGPLHAFVENYLEESKDGSQDSGRHSPAKQAADIKVMLCQLVDDANVFARREKRKQTSGKVYKSLLHKQSEFDIRKWLRKTCKKIIVSN